MEIQTFIDYAKSVDVLTAQQMMNDITVSSYPHMKKHSQGSLLQKLKTAAYRIIKKDNPRLATIQSVLDNLARKR